MAVASAHAPAHDRLAINRAGLWLFFFSESILFSLLLSARFYLEGIDREHVDQLLGLGITGVLLTSSVFAYMAETAMEKDRRGLSALCFLATILLGLVFAVGVGFEWATAEFGRQEAYGTVFFAMTGVHASHVISGIGILVLVVIQMLRGKWDSTDHFPVSAAAWYWHFVDVVWVFFYPALYLVS